MTGQEFLEEIQAKLKSGKRQNRKGQTILRAFGYTRRRKTSIDVINGVLEDLGLIAEPPISTEMPLRSRIIFSLRDVAHESLDSITTLDTDIPLLDDEDDDSNLPVPAFTVSELPSATTDVEWVNPEAPIKEAYTKMRIGKYSQLVVANKSDPKEPDIKGIISFESIAKALMNGEPKKVGDCIDGDVHSVQRDADIKSILSPLNEKGVVLVIGQYNKLQGIVTPWDLTIEFTNLVDPFKRIGEIEERLQTLIKRLGPCKVADFLSDDNSSVKDIRELTIGDLQRVLEYPGHWDALDLAFDRQAFIAALDDVRNYRNRLMHFGDPLKEPEMTRITNFCDMVREIQL